MNKETETLCRLFKALSKAKSILGEDNWHEIRQRLVTGSLKTEEAEFLQNIRRNAAAASLGKTRDQYEDFLENPPEIKPRVLR